MDGMERRRRKGKGVKERVKEGVRERVRERGRGRGEGRVRAAAQKAGPRASRGREGHEERGTDVEKRLGLRRVEAHRERRRGRGGWMERTRVGGDGESESGPGRGGCLLPDEDARARARAMMPRQAEPSPQADPKAPPSHSASSVVLASTFPPPLSRPWRRGGRRERASKGRGPPGQRCPCASRGGRRSLRPLRHG